MTVKGRVSRRGGRTGMKDDPEVVIRSYPTLPDPQPPAVPEMKEATLGGRPGAAERSMHVAWFAAPYTALMTLSIELTGWIDASIDLDERQARFLRDTLNDWFPD